MSFTVDMQLAITRCGARIGERLLRIVSAAEQMRFLSVSNHR